MLNVQAYLRDGRSASTLSSELEIGVFVHPTLPLVGLKYGSKGLEQLEDDLRRTWLEVGDPIARTLPNRRS